MSSCASEREEESRKVADEFVSSYLQPTQGFKAPFGVEPRLVRFLREEQLHVNDTAFAAPKNWSQLENVAHVIKLMHEELGEAFSDKVALRLLWSLAVHLPLRSEQDLHVLLLCLLRIPARIYTTPADADAYTLEDGGKLRTLMRAHAAATGDQSRDFSVRSQLLFDLTPMLIQLDPIASMQLLRDRLAALPAL